MEDNLREILLSVMKDDTIEILPDSILTADLGISSFDLLQVIYGIETEFSINIPKEQVKKIVTFRDLSECINNLIK